MNKLRQIELDENELAEQTLNYILDNQNTCLESSLFLSILDPRLKYGDLHDHTDFLKERLSHLEFFVDYDTVEFKNEMSTYQVLSIDGEGNTFDNSSTLGPMRLDKENFSKEIFWANDQEERCYKNISNFRCFEDKIIPKDKFARTVINAPFNLQGWETYYQKLLEIKFPKFSEQIILGKNIIKYYNFKGDFFLGIETNYQLFKTNLKKDFYSEPHHRLIIFKFIDKKN